MSIQEETTRARTSLLDHHELIQFLAMSCASNAYLLARNDSVADAKLAKRSDWGAVAFANQPKMAEKLGYTTRHNCLWQCVSSAYRDTRYLAGTLINPRRSSVGSLEH